MKLPLTILLSTLAALTLLAPAKSNALRAKGEEQRATRSARRASRLAPLTSALAQRRATTAPYHQQTADATTTFSRVGTLTFNPGESNSNAPLIDPAGGYAYFGTTDSPGKVVKVRLSDFTEVASLTLNPGENQLDAGGIDPAADFAYFVTDTTPGIIVKVRLSNMTRVAALSLNPGENLPFTALIDTTTGFLYVPTGAGDPVKIIKVRLSDFTRVATLSLKPGEDAIWSGTIDTSNGFAYFAGIGGIIVKVRLSDFTEAATLTLNPQDGFADSVVIDAAAGYLYVGNGVSSTPPPADSRGKVVKVRLSDFTEVASLTLNPGEGDFFGAAIDTLRGYAYFVGNYGAGAVVQVRLSDFTRAAGINLTSNELGERAIVDLAAGFFYVTAGTLNGPGDVVKIDISGPTRGPGTLAFGGPAFTTSEACAETNITVTRTNGSTSAVTIDYATSDGTAQQRAKYTLTSGTLTFAEGETAKTFPVLITKDAYSGDTGTVNLTLTNPTGGASLGPQSAATLNIMDNPSVPANSQPIDGAATFACQHYHDFLTRQADQAGQDYWTSQITQCNGDQACVNQKRIDVSNAFFFELEFQQTGAYVFRLYRGAYGDNQPFPDPMAQNLSEAAEAAKLPAYSHFMPDRARVVGGTDLSSGQQALANAFVQRPEFINRYPLSLTGTNFVNAVLQTITTADGVDLSSQMNNLMTVYNEQASDTSGRAAVIYRLANNDPAGNAGINNQPFIDAEYDRAFVTTQYFGYLRRDPDIAGFLFWLGRVNSAPLRSTPAQHAMVCSFVTSLEYQNRFSAAVTHTNQECPQ